jgi:hypothetical protein
MRSYHPALLCAALLTLTVVAYLPIWNNDFVNFDDEIGITANPEVRAGLSWSGFHWAWTNEEFPYRQPITWLSLQFDAQFFSTRDADGEVHLWPAGFHGHNLFWHAANVLLLFALLQRLTGAQWRSFLVAGLFAIHPMHVESVAWATERKDVLSVFFGLLTVWAYVQHLRKPGGLRFLAMMAAYALSMLSKPMLITLPLLLLLLDYWPLRRLGGKGEHETASEAGPGLKPASFRQLVLEKLPLFALAVLFAGLTLISRLNAGALVSLETVPVSDRLANALSAYGWYVASTFWPANLAALYPHPYSDWSPTQAAAGAACLLGITVLGLWQARRQPWLIAGWLWFVIAMAPMVGLAQGGAQAWADRFSYWPHIGLFAAVVWTSAALVERFRVPRGVCAAGAALLLACLAVLTWIQVGYWRDSITLWERALAVSGENERIHLYLSTSYRKAGRIAEADHHLARSNALQTERLRRTRERRSGIAGRPGKSS